MRKAFEKLAQLYQSNALVQDALETAAGAGVAAAGQALFTDMTPEEIAIATAAGAGAAMVGRPVAGYAGRKLGGIVDRRDPELGKEIIGGIHSLTESAPKFVQNMYKAKMGPYAHMGGAAQYGNLLGRSMGDNIAQGLVALAAPGILSGEVEE